MPIYWAAKNFFAFQILQIVSIVCKYFEDIERPEPEGIKFTVFSLFLPGCIPFEHQITLLEIFLFALSVKSLLDLLLMMVGPVHDLLSDLLYFHHLMNPSDHMIRFSFKVLKEIRHR
jgi:hypothetical protein